MIKRTCAFVLVGVLLSGFAGNARAEEQSEIDKVLRQLGRGIGNVATGIFEVPANVLMVQNEDGEVAAITYGLLRGVWRFGVREVVGVFEIASTPFVRLNPIVQPEWSSEGGPISAIYANESRYPTATVIDWKVNPLSVNRSQSIPEPLPPAKGEGGSAE